MGMPSWIKDNILQIPQLAYELLGVWQAPDCIIQETLSLGIAI
jgi:hypothetical protein